MRGDLRTYRIHLTSGHVLMSPNDQYLWIVAARDNHAAAEMCPLCVNRGRDAAFAFC